MSDFDLESFRPPSNAKSVYSNDSRTRSTRSTNRTRSTATRSSASSTLSPMFQGQNERHPMEEETSAAPLTWRLDPDESLSDWTIIVLVANDEEKIKPNYRNDNNSVDDSLLDDDSFAMTADTRAYHVHRTQLGVGPRRSEYFARLFRTKRKGRGDFENHKEEVDDDVSRIELKPTAADAFPLMLDFMYSPPGTPVAVTTESAVALRHLATCFGIRELFAEVTAFIQKDLNMNTASVYLHEAGEYNHEKLLAATLKLCSLNFSTIKLSSLVALSPNIFHRVVTSPHLKCDSETLSLRVASYCRCRPSSVSREMLLSMTTPELVPRVAPDEALFLISVLVQLGMTPDNRDTEDDNGTKENTRGPTLYDRCVKASAGTVRHAVQETSSRRAADSSSSEDKNKKNSRRRNVDAEYYGLPSDVKIDLLEFSLARKEGSSRAVNDSDSVDTGPPSKDKNPTKEEYNRLKRAFEKKLSSYQSQLSTKEDEIRRYAAEMSKFSRVENEYRVPPLISEYTFKAEPEYDRYGESRYGFIPPTALPRIGHHDGDGWLYREEKWNEGEDGRREVRHWPMFYYKAN